MVKHHQGPNELLQHLRDQISFMIWSGISFDNGFEGEAKRIAISIRILVHDTTQSSALLSQLGLLKNTLFYDSATPFHPENIISSSCLTMMKISVSPEAKSQMSYEAPLDARLDRGITYKKIGFNRWWNTQVVLKDTAKNKFYRRTLILSVADRDGGAHVDPTLDESYAKLSRFNSLGWKFVDATGTEIDSNNPVPASIRQINHEVIKTVRDCVANIMVPNDEIFNEFRDYDKHCLQVVKNMR